MRYSLGRSRARSQERECGNGQPRCRAAPAPGVNPLGLCVGCLAAYAALSGAEVAPSCPACTPFVIVREDGRHWHPAGRMCFACGFTVGGTVATEPHRAEARALMRARLLVLFDAGDRGIEWAALLARCPANIRAAFERRLAVTPPVPADG